ncbi:beta-N-acetylhexosaminidase [Paenibacillus caui]|uniref:beta-N-acetylhexosaminidase n=1 Tax=Paenibacillus caui TaxID=2873927 RepID=UPI001CA8566C|nr:beta-N-acetylhexosaminidase [Paenibacillus caui]
MIKSKRLLLLLTAAAICIFPAGCGQSNTNTNANANANSNSSSASTDHPSPTPSAETSTVPEAPKPTETPDPVKEKLKNMSLDEKIGQMVIVGLEGTTLQEQTRKMIDTYKVGGFILYKNNITDADQTPALLNELKKANRNNAAPLWLSVDQEGGRVSRMPESYVKLPKARQIGNTNNENYANRIGQALGEEVKSLGFNMDFAPVLDINSNPDNPVIGDRSFGAKADTVTKHGIAVMKGIQSEGVAAVVKHFPGHGDTSVDSHLELPVVNKSLKNLESFELLPFKSAIQNDTDAVMVAHLLIPKIDNKFPASMSSKIITDLLRNSLHYDGVVITDDMTMGGIIKHFGIAEAAVKSVQAGSDLVLVGHDDKSESAVVEALREAARNGTISSEDIDKHVYRVLKLKQKYNLSDKPLKSVDVDAVNDQVRALLKK